VQQQRRRKNSAVVKCGNVPDIEGNVVSRKMESAFRKGQRVQVKV